jgi:ferredoxin
MSAKRIAVDPIACDGHGLCAELFPERITVDDWGYPIVDSEPLSATQLEHAQRAINACPVMALKLRAAMASPAAAATARSTAAPRAGASGRRDG